MNIKDFYCLRCSLQFDKKSIFDMHLSIVHGERIEIKEEEVICKNNQIWTSKRNYFVTFVIQINRLFHKMQQVNCSSVKYVETTSYKRVK